MLAERGEVPAQRMRVAEEAVVAAAVIRVDQESFGRAFPVTIRFYTIPPAVKLLIRIHQNMRNRVLNDLKVLARAPECNGYPR